MGGAGLKGCCYQCSRSGPALECNADGCGTGRCRGKDLKLCKIEYS